MYSALSIPRLSYPPWAPQHKWLPTAVCVHCGWVNAEHEFRVWVTILGCVTSLSNLFVEFENFFIFLNMPPFLGAFTQGMHLNSTVLLFMRRRLGFKSNFAYQHTKNTCIYTYKHSHIHINFHAYTLLNTRTYIYTSKHSHIHIHFHAYTPINTRTYI